MFKIQWHIQRYNLASAMKSAGYTHIASAGFTAVALAVITSFFVCIFRAVLKIRYVLESNTRCDLFGVWRAEG